MDGLWLPAAPCCAPGTPVALGRAGGGVRLSASGALPAIVRTQVEYLGAEVLLHAAWRPVDDGGARLPAGTGAAGRGVQVGGGAGRGVQVGQTVRFAVDWGAALLFAADGTRLRANEAPAHAWAE